MFPKTLSAEWDCDGLQCCADPERELRRVLVALDATEKVIDCAIDGGYDLILTHHPMIFGKTGDIVPERLYGNRIIKLIAAGVSAASFHTRLDAGEGGVNDCLAEALGFSETDVFGDAEMPTVGRVITLDDLITADELCDRVKTMLGSPSVRLTGDGDVQTVALRGGSGKDFIGPAQDFGADAIITGEVPYNTALDMAESGMVIIEAGHYYTEFPVCERLADLVRKIAGAAAVVYDEHPQKYF